MRHLIILLVLLGFSISSQAQNTPNPCLTINDYTIVVIGSSTAAGAGANPSSMAWVNRYRDFLDSINPGNDVINLALGGYNTYRLMPSNFVPPINRPVPDTARNITKAISLNPDAIIVNLPSNDAGAFFCWLFPNILLTIYPWGMLMVVLRPLGPKLTMASYNFYGEDRPELAEWAAQIKQTGAEDERALESMQEGVGSRLYNRGRYVPEEEAGLHHFHRLLLDFLKKE